MPEKAGLIWRQVGGPGELSVQRFTSLMALDSTGWRVAKGEPLFPKDQSPKYKVEDQRV
jgi:hypothetical protein